MNRRTVFFGFLLTLTLACAGTSLPAFADGQSKPAAASSAALSKVLDAAVERGDTPGVVALVVDRKGVLFESAAGKLNVANNTPMPSNAIFNIASMTKPVTSVAIMILLEQGKLGLDDPVSKFLPGFDKLQVIKTFNEADGTFTTQPATQVMTVRHLLSHTSGIGYSFSSPIVHKLLQGGSQKPEWEIPLLSEPGTKWNYSASTRVLGLIVAKISGQTLEAFDQQYIFKPLGMNDTSYAVPVSKRSRVPTLHRHVDGKLQEGPQDVPAVATGPFRGDGGLYSTAHDYGQFMRMFLNEGKLGKARILSAESVRMMGENQIGAIFVEQQPAAMPELTKPFPLGAGRDKFGLGFQITSSSDDASGVGYRSPGSLSWAGLFNTEFWIDPTKHIGGTVLMQMLPFYDDGAIRTLREFEAATYQQFAVH